MPIPEEKLVIPRMGLMAQVRALRWHGSAATTPRRKGMGSKLYDELRDAAHDNDACLHHDVMNRAAERIAELERKFADATTSLVNTDRHVIAATDILDQLAAAQVAHPAVVHDLAAIRRHLHFAVNPNGQSRGKP